MRNKRPVTGKLGEALAEAYLTNLGMQLLKRNWRAGRAEVDLILREGSILVFVEVKTRSTERFGSPGSFLKPEQEERIGTAASAFCESAAHEWEIRFDLVEVTLYSDNSAKVRHFKDAFYPGDIGW